jgi:hypothetical protein
LVARETFIVAPDQARQAAEKVFEQKERSRGGRKAIAEIEAEAHATREKTPRLKTLRLAQQAEPQNSNRHK